MEGTIGEIRMFAGTFSPREWAFCSGQMMSIAQFQALYSVLGAYYGGDGRVTFALPDLRPKDENGKPRDWRNGETKYIVCLNGIYPQRS